MAKVVIGWPLYEQYYVLPNPQLPAAVQSQPGAEPECTCEGEFPEHCGPECTCWHHKSHVIVERETRNGWTYIHCSCADVLGPYYDVANAEDAFDNHSRLPISVEPAQPEPGIDWNNDEAVVRAAYSGQLRSTLRWDYARQHPVVQAYERANRPSAGEPKADGLNQFEAQFIEVKNRGMWAELRISYHLAEKMLAEIAALRQGGR